MINSAQIVNVDAIHSCYINTDTIPLHDFDPQITERTILNRQKSQDHGLWPTKSLRDQMEIHMEGDIFGNSSADYFDNRMALVAALYGDPNTPPVLTNRKYGDLILDMEGSSENWTCEFTITLFSAPLTGLSPSRTPFALTIVSWTPWFVGVTSGDRYYYA